MENESRYFYSNSVEIGASDYDMMLRFVHNSLPPGAIGNPNEPIKQHRVSDITITVSPQQAKSLVGALLGLVLKFEERHGKLVIPSDKLEQVEMAVKEANKKWGGADD